MRALPHQRVRHSRVAEVVAEAEADPAPGRFPQLLLRRRQPVLEKLHDKVSGLGLLRFDKPNRKITIECWPFLADPTQLGTQFPGWPITIDMRSPFL